MNNKLNDVENAKIAIAGTGYLGLLNATLLVQHNDVVAVDIIQEKADMINNKRISNSRQGDRRILGHKRIKFSSYNRCIKSIPSS